MKNKISFFLNRNCLLILLSLAACTFYFIILNRLGSMEYIRGSLYFTSDSNEYREYTKWISGESDYCSQMRTFFYPLILLISTKLMGFYGIWYVHFIFWIVACDLIFLTTYNITKKKTIAAISFILAASNISIIVYTTHALTETTVFFLLSILVYILSDIRKKYHKLSYQFGLILIISILGATKPIYQIIWYITIVTFLILQIKTVIKKPFIIALILLASTPVIMQKSISKIKFGSFSNAQAADYNLKDYLYRKTKFYVDNDSIRTDEINKQFNVLSDSIHAIQTKQINMLSNVEIIKYLVKHPFKTITVFWKNIYENIGSGNPYISKPSNRSLYKWTETIVS